MAIKIKLRLKAISGNRHALYLDFYPAIINPQTGKETRREFLNMYLFNEIEECTINHVLTGSDNLKINESIRYVLSKLNVH